MSADTTETDASDRGIVESIRDTIQDIQESAHVERAYGEPIETRDKTVVPVARIAYAFGGGFGQGDLESDDGAGEGGGGGGGVVAQPIGALEITEQETRFVRFTNWKRLAVAVAVGVVLGVLLGRR